MKKEKKIEEHSLRQAILDILRESDFEHYLALREELNCGYTILSQQLRILEDENVIRRTKTGILTVYFLKDYMQDEYKVKLYSSIITKTHLTIVLLFSVENEWEITLLSQTLKKGLGEVRHSCNYLVLLGLLKNSVDMNHYQVVEINRQYIKWLLRRYKSKEKVYQKVHNELNSLSLDYNGINPEDATILKELSLLINKKINMTFKIENSPFSRQKGQYRYVSQINLTDKGLDSLPQCITKFRKLKILTLNNNKLTSVPSEIKNLTNLTALNITNNQLTSLPESIVELTNLKTITLAGNPLISLPLNEAFRQKCIDLSITLTSNITSNEKEILHELELKNDIILPRLPSESQGNFGYFERDQHVTILRLKSQRITTLPDSIWNLKELVELSLSGQINELSDSIQQLTKLKTFDIMNTSITKIPNGLAKIPSIQIIHLNLGQLENIGQIIDKENIIKPILKGLGHFKLYQLKDINLKAIEKPILLSIIKNLSLETDFVDFSIFEEILEYLQDTLWPLFYDYIKKISTSSSDDQIEDLGLLGYFIIADKELRSKFLSSIRKSCIKNEKQVIINLCSIWINAVSPLDEQPDSAVLNKTLKLNIVEELTKNYYNFQDEEEFISGFRIIQDLALTFLSEEESYMNYLHVKPLTEPIDELHQRIGQFSKNTDEELVKFFNSLSGLDLSAKAWRKLQWKLSDFFIEGSPEYTLSGLIKDQCFSCHGNFEEKTQLMVCDVCESWVCCGFIEFQKESEGEFTCCYDCLEDICGQALGGIEDLEYYSEEDDKDLLTFTEYVNNSFCYLYETKLEELLSLSFDQVVSITHNNKSRGFFVPRFSDWRVKYRKLLSAWFTKEASKNTITITGLTNNNEKTKIKFKDSIRKLYIYNTQLAKIDLSPLSSCPNLETVSIGGNNLVDLDLSPLEGLTKLTSLNLDNNKLEKLDLSPLKTCLTLKILNLYNNNIQEVNLTPLINLENLEYLGLSGNQKIQIHLDTTNNCKSYLNINLDENSLTEIDLMKFNIFKNLTVLSLRNNKLKTIDLRPLSMNTSLSKILLDNNPINELDLKPLLWNRNLDSVSTNGISKVVYPDILLNIKNQYVFGKWWLQLLTRKIKINFINVEDYYGSKPCTPEIDALSLGKNGVSIEEIDFWHKTGRYPSYLTEYSFYHTGKYLLVEKTPSTLEIVRCGEWKQGL